MGRTKSNHVYKHFNLDMEGLSQCKLCNRILKGQHGANLMKHLKAHTTEYEETKRLNSLREPIRYPSPTTSEDEAEAAGDASISDGVWNFFEKEPLGRCKCVICQEMFTRNETVLRKHLKALHPKVALGLQDDLDSDDNNCYTEVVYLEEEGNNASMKKETPKKKIEIMNQKPKPEKRKWTIEEKQPAQTKNDEQIEEIDIFGKYVVASLRKLPDDMCTELQLEIFKLITSAKLKNMAGTSKSPPNVAVTTGDVTVLNSIASSSHVGSDVASTSTITVQNGNICNNNESILIPLQ